jgi:hypothetical protein
MSRRDEFGISCSRFGIFEKSATRNTRFHSPPTRRLPITHLCFSYFTAATRRGYILFRSGEFQRMGSVLPESTCTLWLLSTANASFLDVRSRCDSNAIFVPSFNFLKIHFRYFFRLVGDAFETDKTDTRHAARWISRFVSHSTTSPARNGTFSTAFLCRTLPVKTVQMPGKAFKLESAY